jgi:hypothetical protein
MCLITGFDVSGAGSLRHTLRELIIRLCPKDNLCTKHVIPSISQITYPQWQRT